MDARVDVVERAYAVVGATAADLERAVFALGPRRGGRRFAAYTDWSIVWRYAASPTEGDACVGVGACVVEARAVVTLPMWRPLRATPTRLRERWARWVDALRAHEEGHVRVAAEARAAVQSAIAAVGPLPDSIALHDAVERAAADALARAHRADRDYDAATRDGATQGAGLDTLIGALCVARDAFSAG